MIWIVLLLLAAILIIGLAVQHQLRHRSTVARNRVRHLRLRLHLRLHPGKGFASSFELWLRWGRLASYRESGRTRPSLSRWHRLTHPAEHSTYLGRAHHGLGVRVTVQENGVIIGPPRSMKSALLAHKIMDAPGAVISTSSKPDMFRLCAPVRARKGPVYVFNPQNVGGIPSNVRWSPLPGCEDPTTAIRRADAFAQAVATSGTDDGTFWATKAGDGMRAMFAAAALGQLGMDTVTRWVGTDREVLQAVSALQNAGHTDWAAQLQTDMTGPAEKTTATIRMVINSALGFLNDPALRQAVLPGEGEQFDPVRFLAERGTLFMIAKSNGKDSVVAPLFAALADEVMHAATQIGSISPGGRLDPPLYVGLDEPARTCPLAIPQILSDAGGQGISVWVAFHGWSQIRSRWGIPGAGSVLDTTNVHVLMPGIEDTETLDHAARQAGQVYYPDTGGSQPGHIPVLTPDMIRRLPAGFALLQRTNMAPVIVRVAAGWKHRGYLRAEREQRREERRQSRLPVLPAPELEAIEAAPVGAIDGSGLVIDSQPERTPGRPWRSQ